MSAPKDRMQQIIEEGRYAISSILGSGGMGIVYLARDRVLGREVALKVLRESYARSEEFTERFRREARNAAALSHPNIVSIYDRGESESGLSYIAMEYVNGGTLTGRISQEAPLPPEEAARIALGVANALNEAHRRGIIHRDIKSENILLTEEGEAKVADFGIARAAEATTMTHTGQVFGTVSYVSPEQAAGDEVGPESDLYSLGILLYEMLTGEVPFEAESPIGVAIKHVRETPVPVERKNPKVPEELASLTTALLSKDPADRPSPAGEVAAQLERYLEVAQENAAAALVSATASVLADEPEGETEAPRGGAATRVMERVTSVGTVFQRKRRAALLCAVAVLPLAVIFALLLYHPASQQSDKALAPILEPKAASVGTPDEAVPNVGNEKVVLEESSSSVVQSTTEKYDKPSEPSGGGSSGETNTVAARAASGSGATSSAASSASTASASTASASAASASTASASASTASASAAPSSATSAAAPATAQSDSGGSTSPATAQAAAQSTAGSSAGPAPTAGSSNSQQPPPQPQPKPTSNPSPTSPEPEHTPSRVVVPAIPSVGLPETTIPINPSAGSTSGVQNSGHSGP